MCEGSHKHQQQQSRLEDGRLRTSVAQTYTSVLCKRLAKDIANYCLVDGAVYDGYVTTSVEGSGRAKDNDYHRDHQPTTAAMTAQQTLYPVDKSTGRSDIPEGQYDQYLRDLGLWPDDDDAAATTTTDPTDQPAGRVRQPASPYLQPTAKRLPAPSAPSAPPGLDLAVNPAPDEASTVAVQAPASTPAAGA